MLSFRLLANANTVQVTAVSQSIQNLQYTRSVRFGTYCKMEVTMVRGRCAALLPALSANKSALSGVHLMLNVSGRHKKCFGTRNGGTYGDVGRAAWHSSLGQHSANVAGRGVLQTQVVDRGMGLMCNGKPRLTA